MNVEKDEESKRKFEIKRELISKDLTNYLKLFIPTLLLLGLFGYIGYLYNKDNNGDIVRGIIFGAIYPLGLLILKIIKEINISSWNVSPYIIYTIIWICIADSMPFWIGITILSVTIVVFIALFIIIEVKDRSKEINEIYGNRRVTQETVNIAEKQKSKNTNTKYKYVEEERGIFNESGVYMSPTELRDMGKEGLIEKAIIQSEFYIEDNKDEEAEYECERCFKKISYEEWETYDMMCEDCFMDVHLDEDGNYHDEEIGY